MTKKYFSGGFSSIYPSYLLYISIYELSNIQQFGIYVFELTNSIKGYITEFVNELWFKTSFNIIDYELN
jgi:hypothetical protein